MSKPTHLPDDTYRRMCFELLQAVQAIGNASAGIDEAAEDQGSGYNANQLELAASSVNNARVRLEHLRDELNLWAEDIRASGGQE